MPRFYIEPHTKCHSFQRCSPQSVSCRGTDLSTVVCGHSRLKPFSKILFTFCPFLTTDFTNLSLAVVILSISVFGSGFSLLFCVFFVVVCAGLSWLQVSCRVKKDSQYSITEHRVPELIPVLGSQPAGDVSHKPGGRLPLLFARPAVTLAILYQFRCLVNRGMMGVNSLPKTVTRQRRNCDLNPGPSAPESSTLTTRLPSHPAVECVCK